MINLLILQGDMSQALGSFAPMLIVLVIIYFFFIRPQNKKQNLQNDFIKSLTKGQDIVTSSGIIGKINKIEDREITIQTDSKTFLRMTRGAISREMTEAYLKVEDKK